MSELDNDLDDDVLSPKQEIFVAEYIIDFNAARAAKAAGFSPHTARQLGYRMTKMPKIMKAIDEAKAARKERCNIDSDAVLNMYWSIATADYNEVVQLRRTNCRYCFGDNNEYQWTVAEYENACIKAVSSGEPEPVCAGGVGFNVNGDPNTLCPECKGNGVESVYIEDTTKLSAQANLIYQGAKEGKYGVEVMMLDRVKALDSVARHLGMFKETVNHVSDDGSMTPVPAGMDLSKLTDEELKSLSNIVAKTEAD